MANENTSTNNNVDSQKEKAAVIASQTLDLTKATATGLEVYQNTQNGEVLIQGVPESYCGGWCWKLGNYSSETGLKTSTGKNPFKVILNQETLLNTRILRTKNAYVVISAVVTFCILGLQSAQLIINDAYSDSSDPSRKKAANLTINCLTIALPLMLTLCAALISTISDESIQFRDRAADGKKKVMELSGYKSVTTPLATGGVSITTTSTSVMSGPEKNSGGLSLNAYGAICKARFGFENKDVGGGGNCQFLALADQLLLSNPTLLSRHKNIETLANQLRIDACDHILRYSDKFTGFIKDITMKTSKGEYIKPKGINEYIAIMREDGTYGDQCTLRAIQLMFKKHICILKKGKGNLNATFHSEDINNVEPKQDNTLVIFHEDESEHFQSITDIPNDDFFKLFKNNIKDTIPVLDSEGKIILPSIPPSTTPTSATPPSVTPSSTTPLLGAIPTIKAITTRISTDASADYSG